MTPHLLHVLPGFAPGGTELRLAKLINAMGPVLRHSVLPLDGDRSAQPALDRALGVRFVDPPPASGALGRPLALRRIARAVDPAVILTYNWGATDMLLGAMWGSRARFIHNECGFGPDEAERLISRRVWIRRLLLRRADATVVVSERLVRIARGEFQVPQDRLRYIRTGVDTVRFSPGRNDTLRAGLGFGRDDIVFGFVGGLRPEKNLPMLIDAFAAAGAPNSRLVLLGDGPLRADLEARAKAKSIANRVVFAGRAADPLPWYRAFDVFVMSSITEQTSNAQLEAMACGLPCIVTDVGDCGRLVSGEAPWSVASGDIATYSKSIRNAMDPGVRAVAGSANRNRTVSEYSLPRMVAEYAHLWFSMAGIEVPAAILEHSESTGEPRVPAHGAGREIRTPPDRAF